VEHVDQRRGRAVGAALAEVGDALGALIGAEQLNITLAFQDLVAMDERVDVGA
jgi:hypothetical protein